MQPMTNPTGKHRPKRRHHGEGTVVLRKDRWRAKPWAAVVPYIDPSGRRRETWLSASSRAEAEDLRKRELERIRKRVLPTDHTVGTYVEGWLMTADVGPATFERYRQHVRLRIVPTLGAVALADLTPPRVRAAMARWSGGASTRMGTLIILRTAMRQAMTDRMLLEDPTAGVKAPTIHVEPPTVLDVDEARALMATVRAGFDPVLAPLITVSLGLGLRRGEALGLRTADVDLDAGRLSVRRSLARVPVPTRDPARPDEWWRLQAVKAGSERTIDLPPFVADTLRERIADRDAEKRKAKVWTGNDFVFGDRHGNPVAYSNLTRWFKEALAAAGLPDMRWHELRASTATILLAEGVPELTVMSVLGHTSLQMTRRYVKMLPRMGKAAAGKMDEAIG